MNLDSILLTLACPSTLSPEHFIAAIEHVEHAIPGADLNYELVPPGRPRRIQDRAALIRDACQSADPSFALYNSIEQKIFSFEVDYLVHWRTESYWHVRFEHPPSELPRSKSVSFILELGDLLIAYHGQRTTYRSGTANSQLNRGMGPDFTPPHGLPPLFPPETYASMAVPFCVEWCNYWSRGTAETMGFSESEHAQLFHRWQRGASGSLAFQLTPEPIDLDRPEDIQALQMVYSAFPGIGGRDPKFRIPGEAPSQEGA